ncbi:GP46-like surface antigen, putative, partial [Bodo saltans]
TLPAVYGPSFKQIVNVLISSTRISGSIPNEWGSWAATVQSIQLYLNSLTGTLPPSFGNFSKLQSLNFAMNNLSGEVPVVAWSKLRGVQSITFQDNPHLYGSIPESWNSVFVAGSFVGLPSMVSVCRSHICAAKLSALPLGYGCIPVSAIPLLATVDASNMVGVLSQITWLRSVACNASVAPPAQHTVTESHTRLIPVHAIDRAAAKLSESQRVTVATAAAIGTTIMILQFLPSSVGGAGSMHALQATTVVQHLRQLCLSQDASGNSYDYSNDVGANADNAVCCDAGTSPTQLSVGSGVHEAPLAGAIIGNTILVAAISGARLLLQYFLVRKCHLQLVEERDTRCGTDAPPKAGDSHHVLVLDDCPALMSVLQTMAQLTHGGIVASLWVPFTALFTPTVAAGNVERKWRRGCSLGRFWCLGVGSALDCFREGRSVRKICTTHKSDVSPQSRSRREIEQ